MRFWIGIQTNCMEQRPPLEAHSLGVTQVKKAFCKTKTFFTLFTTTLSILSQYDVLLYGKVVVGFRIRIFPIFPLSPSAYSTQAVRSIQIKGESKPKAKLLCAQYNTAP